MKIYSDHTMDQWSEEVILEKIMFGEFKALKDKLIFSYFLSRALEFFCNLTLWARKETPLTFCDASMSLLFQ